jgi:predicted flap endonuclease-1-like 5' DNA nuclease
MSPETRESIDKARESMGKAAYAAVGAPVAAIKALSARVADLRDAVRASSKDMSDDLTREMNEWIAEGEKVIEKAMKRLRSSGAFDEVRSRAKQAKEAAEVGIDKASDRVEKGLDVISPEEELTTINGIGPSYARQLEEAGVTGVADFLAQTGSARDVDRIADATGISSGTIESWRGQAELTRIGGIGESFQMLLHRAGVWTMSQLAASDPVELADELQAIDMPDAPEQMPSSDTVADWVSEAKKLS